MVRQPLAQEIAAATAVAADVGLGVVAPEVIKLAKHTTLRLAPFQVVGRVLPEQAEASEGALARELLVATHLASHLAPTVRPTSHVPPGPYFQAGCAITLWELVNGTPPQSDEDVLVSANALRKVHAALADFHLDLPSFTVAIDSCEAILSNTATGKELAVADRAFLQTRYEELRSELARRELTRQPLHGDAHLGNVLLSNSNPVWFDFEAVCVGPLEWDIVSLPSITWYEFDGLDPDLMQLLGNLRSVCVAVWCWADFGRSTAVAEAAVYHLRKLRQRFS